MSIQLERGTTDLPIFQAIKINLKNLPKSFTWGALLSGFLIVLISTTGPIAILFQAAEAGKFSDQQLASWLLTVDRKSTRLNSSHMSESRMPSSA